MNSKHGIRRLAVRFEGEVQGVGFRWTSRSVANRLGVTGWVRNEWDGSVSAEIQGTGEQIAEFFGTLPHSWGYFTPTYIIADKNEIEPIPGEPSFRERF